MPRFETRPDNRLLVHVLRDPDRLARLSPQQFSQAMDAAEEARLLGWLVTAADSRRVPEHPPGWLADRLTSARALVGEYDRAVRWEIDRINRAFLDAGLEWVLLKGAAYLAASLPPGRGRRVADVDVLVRYSALGEAERVLKAHGWQFGAMDPYDERYYREWMHELPPMAHADRQAVIDVHHAILPRTGRLRPSSARLVDQSIEVDAGIRVLRPSHMILHAAAHLFHDGEIAGAIRDLVDLDGLLRQYGKDGEFWREFAREAGELDLRRPAYYAIRYATRMFDTPVPEETIEEMNAWAPAGPVRSLMDVLVSRAIPGPTGHASSAAAFLLYVRSHWLRMPPWRLAVHLTRKSLRRNTASSK